LRCGCQWAGAARSCPGSLSITNGSFHFSTPPVERNGKQVERNGKHSGLRPAQKCKGQINRQANSFPVAVTSRETIFCTGTLCSCCCYERSFPQPLTHPLQRRAETILAAYLARPPPVVGMHPACQAAAKDRVAACLNSGPNSVRARFFTKLCFGATPSRGTRNGVSLRRVPKQEGVWEPGDVSSKSLTAGVCRVSLSPCCVPVIRVSGSACRGRSEAWGLPPSVEEFP
jgi:hypothetical protein